MKSPSPLKWVGGKTRLLPTIKKYLPPVCHNYYEPFVGGGALFFDYGWKCDGMAYLQDINHPLINTYDHLQSAFDETVSAIVSLQDTPYETIKAQFNSLKVQFETFNGAWSEEDGCNYAACFIALNHLCFNGIYRENKKGEFNVPVGKDSNDNPRTLKTLDFDKLREASRKLRFAGLNWTSFDPWSHILIPGKKDVVFFDPAYLKEFSSYDKSGFTAKDHEVLCKQALAHAANGATVVVCGSNNDASRTIYGEPTEVVELSRTVGASNRKKATEALWVWNRYEQ